MFSRIKNVAWQLVYTQFKLELGTEWHFEGFWRDLQASIKTITVKTSTSENTAVPNSQSCPHFWRTGLSKNREKTVMVFRVGDAYFFHNTTVQQSGHFPSQRERTVWGAEEWIKFLQSLSHTQKVHIHLMDGPSLLGRRIGFCYPLHGNATSSTFLCWVMQPKSPWAPPVPPSTVLIRLYLRKVFKLSSSVFLNRKFTPGLGATEFVEGNNAL